jgi:poly(A) polymerase
MANKTKTEIESGLLLLHMKALEEALAPEAIQAVKVVAQELGLESYVVGGFVRDTLLGRKSKDIDFVCVGSGIALAQAVQKKLKGASHVNVYKNFGTASIHHQDFNLEFVGARKESYRTDSRKPIVEDGTLRDDQFRRDFTINALAISLNKGSEGQLVDPFDGVGDLKRKIIRTPLEPEITFSDDPLRMMRAIRFASQLKFDISPETFEAIKTQKERIKIVSQERITDELNKMILAPVPSYGFKLMFHAGLLELIFPEFTRLQGVEEINGRGHKDNFYHTLQVLDNISEHTDDLWLRWAAILHDIAKPATQRYDPKVGWTFHGHEDLGARWVPGIFKKLKLPLNEKMRFVQKLVRLHLRPIALVNEKVTDSAVRRLLFEAGDDIDGLMTLCKADVTSRNPEKVRKYQANFKKVEAKMKELEERDHVRNFQPPVTGEEILATFNIEPSKVIAIIKTEIKDAILEGRIPNQHTEARQLMLDIGRRMGLPLR